MAEKTKKCSKCETEKVATEFPKDKQRPDGLSCWCLDCWSVYRHGVKRPTTNTCSICNQTKDREAFRYDRKCGLRGECLECEKQLLRCNTCKSAKPHQDFLPDKKNSTGRKSSCRACVQQAQNAGRKTPEHRAKRHEYRTCPEVRAKIAEYNKQYQGATKQAVTEKVCTGPCGLKKMAEEFGPNARTSTRLSSWCKRCVADKVKEHRKKPEVKAREAAYAQLPHVVEWHRAYRTSEHGKALRRIRERTEPYRERKRAAKAKRRAKFATIVCTLTVDQWFELLDEYGGACAYCNRRFGPDLTPTQDHVVPVSKGGGHTKENVVPACMHCNCSKRDNEKPVTLPYAQPALPAA